MLSQRLNLAFMFKICQLFVIYSFRWCETFHIFILSRVTKLITTRIGTEHPYVKGIMKNHTPLQDELPF